MICKDGGMKMDLLFVFLSFIFLCFGPVMLAFLLYRHWRDK